jgi:rfaE bifunctional protein kinase chain/domain
MMQPPLELPSTRPVRILVAGEVVLDRYLWGEVSWISPEAPIPVLQVNRREERPGNAAFVCASLAAFGAKPALLTIIGADANGAALTTMLSGLGIETQALVEDQGRPTIVKERLLGSVQSTRRAIQQLLRVDNEDSRPLSEPIEGQVLARLERELEPADGVLICDINKGANTWLAEGDNRGRPTAGKAGDRRPADGGRFFHIPGSLGAYAKSLRDRTRHRVQAVGPGSMAAGGAKANR